MPLLDRLERRFRHWAIPNVTLGIVLGQAFLYVVWKLNLNPDLLQNAMLYPELVLQGEVWRLVSFLFVPINISPLFAIFYFYILYMMGTSLERVWGTFRYNLYLLVGLLATVAAAFFANHFVPGIPASNGFLYGTLFLAFAVFYPDVEFLIMFILPVKVKWLAWFAGFGYGYAFFMSGWMGRLLIAASLFNFFCFFSGAMARRLRHGQHHVADKIQKVKQARTPRHVCRACGITNLDDPKMRFRYCSLCEGQCGYCTEHLGDHEHVLEGVAPRQE